jgi:peptidyl-tRNA hydrolase
MLSTGLFPVANCVGEVTWAAIMDKAAPHGVNYHVVTDAGRTVFKEPTVTCIWLGPFSKSLTRNSMFHNNILRGAE